MRLINQQRHPLPLKDGTTLGAAGSKTDTLDVASIDPDDRRRYHGKIIILEGEAYEVKPTVVEAPADQSIIAEESEAAEKNDAAKQPGAAKKRTGGK